MRLAQSDAGMDVERIEHHRIVAARGRDLLGGCVRQRVRAADHEGVEGQPQIERRTAQARHDRSPPGRTRCAVRCRRASLRVSRPNSIASTCLVFGSAVRITALRTLTSSFWISGVLALPAGQQLFDVVRLDPAFEKAGRHREMRRAFMDSFEFHAGEPALENLFADFGAKPVLYALPTLLLGGCHFLVSFGSFDG